MPPLTYPPPPPPNHVGGGPPSPYGNTPSSYHQSPDNRHHRRFYRQSQQEQPQEQQHPSSSSSQRRPPLPGKDNCRAPSSSSSSSSSRRGLFSIPTLHQPSDFQRLAQEAMTECDTLRQTLASVSTPTSLHQAQDILRLLDDVSQTVCNVIDAAEVCRSVHVSPSWRDASQQAFDTISDYIALLNADTCLYRALQLVTTHPQYFTLLTHEEQRFAILLQEEFERDGIHLPLEQRDLVRHYQNHVTQLETLFTENITHSSHKYYQVAADPVTEIIPSPVLARHVPQQQPSSSETVTLSSDPSIANTLLKYSSNPQLRQDVYRETYTSCPENLQVLEALVKCRHQVATTLGYASYVDRFLQDKMCNTPARVDQFLTQLQQRNAKPYQQSMELLQHAKHHIEGSASGSSLEPWDIPFYTSVLKAQRSGGGFDSSEVSPYLTVSNCIKAMTTLVSKLFDIQMKEETMTREERWDMDTTSAAATKEEEDHHHGGGPCRIRKFTFHHHEQDDSPPKPLGTMYLDLHPRPGKYSHAAHFTVRCGCALRQPQTTTTTDDQEQEKDYQLPVIALVCNMTPPSSSPVLTHSEVETLFHEFGHALHSLLSRTTFQHLAGTRGAMDFVETPSHLLEQYVWDPSFLSLLARHYETGDPIPTDLIAKLVQSRNDLRCVDIQTQILYAKFDQALFGQDFQKTYSSSSSSAGGGATSSSITNPTTDLFAKLHSNLHVPYAPGTHWHTRFGHLVTYGGGYYGYLYAQVFAADIWNHHFQAQSLNRTSGVRLWKDMLRHGGAQDPNVMLRTLLNREPDVESFYDMMMDTTGEE